MGSGRRWLMALACALAAAGGLSAAPQVVERAVFAKSLKEDRSAAEETEAYSSGDTVHLSLELKGRPTGALSAKFFFRDELISQTKLDLAAEASGAAAEGPVFVAFSLKPKAPFPVGDLYHVIVAKDGAEEGRYLFKVAPPADAVASRVDTVALTKAKPDDWRTAKDEVAVAADDPVFVGGAGTFGKESWLEATWLANGEPESGGVQTVNWDANKENATFQFQRRPDGGWKPGRHEVILKLNGLEVARKLFSVRAPATAADVAAVNAPPVLRKATLRRDDKGAPGEEVGAFTPKDRVLHFVCDLEATVPAAAGEITWTLVSAEGGLKDVAMARAPFAVKTANRLTGRFVAARDLPAGSYRVEMTLGGKVFATRDFQVK